MHRAILLLVVLGLCATSVVGCAGSADKGGSGDAGLEAGGEPRLAAPAVEAMEPEQKQTDIDESFPIEVPVAQGEVVRGQAQGSDAWDYDVVVATTPATLADWYRQAYVGRTWAVRDERVLEGGGFELTFEKGGAQSRVSVTPDGSGARASVILGVGAPVLDTQ